MEHVSVDHEDCPNQDNNSHKLCSEKVESSFGFEGHFPKISPMQREVPLYMNCKIMCMNYIILSS